MCRESIADGIFRRLQLRLLLQPGVCALQLRPLGSSGRLALTLNGRYFRLLGRYAPLSGPLSRPPPTGDSRTRSDVASGSGGRSGSGQRGRETGGEGGGGHQRETRSSACRSTQRCGGTTQAESGTGLSVEAAHATEMKRTEVPVGRDRSGSRQMPSGLTEPMIKSGQGTSPCVHLGRCSIFEYCVARCRSLASDRHLP